MKINKKELLLAIKQPSLWRRIAIAVLLVLVLIRPTISNESSSREMTNLNLWFVVDATGSMVAKDVDGGSKRRFEFAREDISAIVKKIPGAKYGLIVQDFSSYTASPLSFSADAIIAAESYTSPKYSFYTMASDLSDLLKYTSTRITKYKKRYPDRNNVIVFMSDGEHVSGEKLAIPSTLKDVLDGIVIFGYGSTEGSLIEEVGSVQDYTSISEDRYITYYGKDSSIEVDLHNQVISKIDENNLRLIADSLGGDYYHRERGTVPDSAISTLIASAKPVKNTSDSLVKTGAEIYWVFALAILVLLLFEGYAILMRIFEEREGRHA